MNYFGFGNTIAIVDSLVLNILLAFACLGIIYIMQFYLPQREKLWYIIAVSLITSVLVIILSQLILKRIFRNEAAYINFLEMAWVVKGSIVFLLAACTSLISLVYYSLEEQKETEQRKHDAEQLTKEAELFNLRQQLQPHFLFNSLNSISALAGNKPEEARKMIQQLSDFLRGTIRKDDTQFITLTDELNHLQLYLDIEKVRFGHRLKTEFKCDAAREHLKIPSLLLQPVVENAIKFGLYDTLDDVLIEIQATYENNILSITVKNPYDSAMHTKQKGTGFGLSSVQRRLYLLFARNDLLFTSANENIFTTTIKIPQ
ncbi:MAG: histidine kinase [Fimbriimonadaceae bacterium]|nr:histidine kinase [Chitinophagales bacterium]